MGDPWTWYTDPPNRQGTKSPSPVRWARCGIMLGDSLKHSVLSPWLVLVGLFCIACADERTTAEQMGAAQSPDAARAVDAMVSIDATGPVEDALMNPVPDLSVMDAGLLDQGPEFITLPASQPAGLGARIYEMDVPIDSASARRAGCLINGLNVGSGPSNVIALGGGFGAQIQPNQDGVIPLLLMFLVQEWTQGLSASELSSVNLSFGRGLHGLGDTFELSSENLTYPELPLEGGWFETSATDFELPISLLNSPTVPLALAELRIRGRLGLDEKGMRIDHGTMVGYITQDSLLNLLSAIRVICQAETPAGICVLIGAQLDQPDADLLSLASGFMGGYDTRFDGNRSVPCDPTESEECDRISACMVFAAEGVSLVTE